MLGVVGCNSDSSDTVKPSAVTTGTTAGSSGMSTQSPTSAPASPETPPVAASSSAAATSPSSGPAATPAPDPSQTPAVSAPDAEEGTIAIEVAAGKVNVKEKVVKVALGSTVTLFVTTDVSDEVHVHGYDAKQNVSAVAPALLSFVADQPGGFEVELENAKLLLVKLQVS